MQKLARGNLSSNIKFLNENHLLDNKRLKILEIGSGKGILVKYLLDQGFDIQGTEYSQEYIDIAKKEFSKNLPLIKMSGEDLKFKDNSFDLVLSFDVLEHIANTDKHLSEVKRVLRDGGIYAFGTPNKITNIPWEILDKKSFTGWKRYHCSLHTYNELKKRLQNHRLEFQFIKVPVFNNRFKEKMIKRLGRFGILLANIIGIDKLPLCLRTNFYVIATKRK